LQQARAVPRITHFNSRIAVEMMHDKTLGVADGVGS
jgi:hypothetical protein